MAHPLSIVRNDMDLLAESESELAQAEHELAQGEQHLRSEMTRLDSAAGGLLGLLQRVKAAASQHPLAVVKEPALAELQRRAGQAELPRLPLNGIRGRALAARRAAVEARAGALEELRQVIQAHASELSRMASQLAADEAELAGYEKLARERAMQALVQPAAVKPAAPSRAVAAPAPATVPQARSHGRRELPRVQMQAAIDFSSDSNLFTGFSTDLSEGGVFIATVSVVPMGSPVDLSFTLPGSIQVKARGVVRWTREINDQTPEIFPGVGVQFVDLTPDVTQALKQFVATREPMFYPD